MLLLTWPWCEARGIPPGSAHMVPGDPQPWQVTRGWEATCWRVAGAVGLPESALSRDRQLGDPASQGRAWAPPPVVPLASLIPTAEVPGVIQEAQIPFREQHHPKREGRCDSCFLSQVKPGFLQTRPRAPTQPSPGNRQSRRFLTRGPEEPHLTTQEPVLLCQTNRT